MVPLTESCSSSGTFRRFLFLLFTSVEQKKTPASTQAIAARQAAQMRRITFRWSLASSITTVWASLWFSARTVRLSDEKSRWDSQGSSGLTSGLTRSVLHRRLPHCSWESSGWTIYKRKAGCVKNMERREMWLRLCNWERIEVSGYGYRKVFCKAVSSGSSNGSWPSREFYKNLFNNNVAFATFTIQKPYIFTQYSTCIKRCAGLMAILHNAPFLDY